MFYFESQKLTQEQVLAVAAMVYDWEERGMDARLNKMFSDGFPHELQRVYAPPHAFANFILPQLESVVSRARILEAVRFATTSTPSAEQERAGLQAIPVWLHHFSLLQKQREEELLAGMRKKKVEDEAAKKVAEANAKKIEEDRKKAEEDRAKALADASAAEKAKQAAEYQKKEIEARRASEQAAEQAKMKAAMDAAFRAKMADETVVPLATYAPIFQEIIENGQCVEDYERKRKMESSEQALPSSGGNLNQMIESIKMKQPLLLTQAVTFMKEIFDRNKVFPNFDDLTRKLFQEIQKMRNAQSQELLSVIATIIAKREILWARKKALYVAENPSIAKVMKAHLGRAIYFLEKAGIRNKEATEQLAIAYNLLAQCPLNYHDDISTVINSALKLESSITKFTREANGNEALAQTNVLKEAQNIIRSKVASFSYDLITLPELERPPVPPVHMIRANMRKFIAESRLGTHARSGKTALHLLAETCTEVKLFKELQKEEAAYITELEAKRKIELETTGRTSTVIPRSAFTMVDTNGLLPGDLAIDENVQMFLNSIIIPKENYEGGIRYWFEGVSGKAQKEATEQGAGVGVIQFQYGQALDARREATVIPNHMQSITTVGEDEPFLLAGYNVPVVMRTFGVEYDYASDANEAKTLAKLFYKLLSKALKTSTEFNTQSVEKLISEANAQSRNVNMDELTKLVRSNCDVNEALVQSLFQQAKQLAEGCIEKMIITDAQDGKAILYFVVKPAHRNNPKVAEALYKMFWDLGIAPIGEAECPAATIMVQTVKDKQMQALSALLKENRYKAMIDSDFLYDKNGNSLLMQSLPAYGGGANQEMACLLINSGATVLQRRGRNGNDYRNNSLLNHVVRYEFETVLPVLMNRLRALLPQKEFNETLTQQMSEALFNRGSVTMKSLLDNGADPNVVIDYGWEWTPAPILLWTAFYSGQSFNDKMALLLGKGANVGAVLPPRHGFQYNLWGSWGLEPGDDALTISLKRLSYYTTRGYNEPQQNVVFIDRIRHLLAAGSVGSRFVNRRAEDVVARLGIQEITALFENVKRGVPVVLNVVMSDALSPEAILAKQKMDIVLARMEALDKTQYEQNRRKRGPAAYGIPGKFHLDYEEMSEEVDGFIEPNNTAPLELRFYQFVRVVENLCKKLATIQDNQHTNSNDAVLKANAASLREIPVRDVAVRITQLSSALGQLPGWNHVEEFMRDPEPYIRKARGSERNLSQRRTRSISTPVMHPSTATAACMGGATMACSVSAAPVVSTVVGKVAAEENWDHDRNTLDITPPGDDMSKLGVVKQLQSHPYGKEAYYIFSYAMNLALDCNRDNVLSTEQLALCVVLQLAKATLRERATNLSFMTRGANILKEAEQIVSGLINMNPTVFAKFREIQSRGVQWPHSPNLRRAIERAGFVFRPMMIKRDRCVCDACGAEVSGWRKYMNPWLLHDWTKRHPFAPPPGTEIVNVGYAENLQREEEKRAAEAKAANEAKAAAEANAAAQKEAFERQAAIAAVANYEAERAAQAKAAAEAFGNLDAFSRGVDVEASIPSTSTMTPMAAMTMTRTATTATAAEAVTAAAPRIIMAD